MTFSTPVTLAGASVTAGTGSVSNLSASGSEVTVNLTGVSNAQQIIVTLANVSDGATMNNVSIPMLLLLGDTNGNGIVNSSDVSQTKAEVGQPITSSNFRTDVNVSGTINATDLSVVKTQVGMGISGALEEAHLESK